MRTRPCYALVGGGFFAAPLTMMVSRDPEAYVGVHRKSQFVRDMTRDTVYFSYVKRAFRRFGTGKLIR